VLKLSIPLLIIELTDKKENQIFLTYKEIQNGAAVAKSNMRKGFLIVYEEMLHSEFPYI
jgi:hypothetical protein